MFTVKADTHENGKRWMFEASSVRTGFIDERNEWCVELFEKDGSTVFETLYVGNKAPLCQVIIENANGKTSEIIRVNIDGGVCRTVSGN